MVRFHFVSGRTFESTHRNAGSLPAQGAIATSRKGDSVATVECDDLLAIVLVHVSSGYMSPLTVKADPRSRAVVHTFRNS